MRILRTPLHHSPTVKLSPLALRKQWLVLAIGFVASFVVAMPIVRWPISYVRRHSFTSFGIYRVLLSLVFIVVGMLSAYNQQ